MGVDRLLPLSLALVDVDELLERGLGERRAVVELGEELLGAVVQPGAEVVLGEREHRLMALSLVQVRPREEVLVHANRALDFAAPTEKVTEREVSLERLVVDFRHLDEQLERLVGLAAQHEVEAANIVGADPRRRIPVPVAIDLEREADRRGHDDDRGEQECGVSWHLRAVGRAAS